MTTPDPLHLPAPPAPTTEPYAYDPRRVVIRDAYGQPVLVLDREQARALWERLGRWLARSAA